MIQTDLKLEPKELLEVLRSGERTEFKALLRNQPEPVVDAAFELGNFEERLEFSLGIGHDHAWRSRLEPNQEQRRLSLI